MATFSRRAALQGLSALGLASVLPTAARARTAPSRLAPGLSAHTFPLGDATVTVVRDTSFDLPLSYFGTNAPDGEVVRLLDAYGLSTTSVPIDASQVLIDAGGVRTLVDAGTGTGALVETLRAIGVEAGSIDRVVVSHFHSDHVGGVSTGDVPTFPSASVHFPAPEMAFLESAPADAQGVAAALDALAPVRSRLETYADGDELAPGLRAVAAHGHTPGHMAFTLTSGDARLMLLSDAVTHPVLFFRHPEWLYGLDMLPEQTVGTRRALLGRAADERTPVMASHLPFPSVGRVSRDEDLFRLTPTAIM